MKDWSITKELALDRRVGASNPCVRTLILGSSSFIVLLFFSFYSSFVAFWVFQFFIAFPPFFVWFFIALPFSPVFWSLFFISYEFHL
jgi:hypothetical protein